MGVMFTNLANYGAPPCMTLGCDIDGMMGFFDRGESSPLAAKNSAIFSFVNYYNSCIYIYTHPYYIYIYPYIIYIYINPYYIYNYIYMYIHNPVKIFRRASKSGFGGPQMFWCTRDHAMP